jgi:hypothetical protein
MERKYETFLGTGLLIAGIVILLFVFAQVLPIATNPGDFVRKQVPESQQAKGPTPSFSWSSNGLSVTFTDTSQAGSVPITSYSWDFGDGNSGNQKNPTHTYGSAQDYDVRLTVQDQNGTSAVAQGTVHPNQSGTNSGSGQQQGGSGMDFNFSISFTPFVMAMVFVGAYMILWLVGASILKAGWNLINPKAEKITLRVKPKHIEVEPVTAPAQPQVVYVQQPAQQYQPPPPPPQG